MGVRRGQRPQILRAAAGVGHHLERLEDRTLLSTINWTNKGQTGDGFNRVFGSNADTARAVIQQALNDWQSVIGNFNNGSNTLNISVSMSTSSGFGASAGGNTQFGGQPTGGNITINTGQNGNGSGWFVDPTPGDDSEFRGNLINAYAADAQTSSPAFGKYDLYTVVVLETAHILGLNDWPGENFAADPHGYLTNTGSPDAAVGAGDGILWAYDGPDVQALFTSDNAGIESRAHALHTAEPNAGNLVHAGGNTYYGAQDSDNAFFEINRRYLPSDLDALVLKDSYGDTINTPSRNMYATFDSNTGNLMLRGGQTGQTIYTSTHAQSNDTIGVDTSSITVPVGGTSSFVSTSVQIGNWVEGTGPSVTLSNSWPLSSVNSITIDTGPGADTVNIWRVPSGIPVSVTSGGTGTVNVGNGASGLDEVLGPVSILNNSVGGETTINVDDGADTGGGTVNVTTFTPPGDTPWGRISGLGPADITFRNNDVAALNISTGAGADTVNFLETGDGLSGDQFTTLLRAGGQGTTVNVGDGSVQNIFGTLLLSNPLHFNTVNVSDNDDSAARAVTIQQLSQPADPSNDSYDTLSGVAPGLISYDNRDTTSATITLGAGGNTVNVKNIDVPTTITGGGGPDTFNITDGGSAQGIAGALSIDNGLGSATITIDDSADPFARSVTLSSFTRGGDTSWQRISGLSPADITYQGDDQSTTHHVTIDGGSGGNTFNITSIAPVHDNTGGIDLNTGAGDDVIAITGTAPGMFLNVNGQDGNDALTVDFSSGNIAGGMTIALDGGAGTDNLTVAGQGPGTPITVHAGHIVDGTSNVNYTPTIESLTLDPATFTVLDDLGGIALNTANAGTVVNLNVTQHLAALNVGDSTTVKLAAGASPGGITVFTNSLSLGSPTAKLDLTNNAIQINYGGGPDPILAVRNQIATAYAGGAWSGPGITTSKGDSGHALGYGDAADGIISGLPANSVLIKFTVAGDLNLDGHVNFNDLLALAQHYGQTNRNWDQGDLNYDGSVNFNDLLKLAQNYNAALSVVSPPLAAAAAMPLAVAIEPVKRRRR